LEEGKGIVFIAYKLDGTQRALGRSKGTIIWGSPSRETGWKKKKRDGQFIQSKPTSEVKKSSTVEGKKPNKPARRNIILVESTPEGD